MNSLSHLIALLHIFICLSVNSRGVLAKTTVYPDSYYKDYRQTPYGGEYSFRFMRKSHILGREIPFYSDQSMTKKIGRIWTLKDLDSMGSSAEVFKKYPNAKTYGFVEFNGKRVCEFNIPPKVIERGTKEEISSYNLSLYTDFRPVKKYEDILYSSKGSNLFACPFIHLQKARGSGSRLRYSKDHKKTIEIITDFGEHLFIAKKDIRMTDDLIDAYSVNPPNVEVYKKKKLTDDQKITIKKAIEDFKKDYHSMTINNFYSKYKLIINKTVDGVDEDLDLLARKNKKKFADGDKKVIHRYIKQQLIPLNIYNEARIASITVKNKGSDNYFYIYFLSPEENALDDNIFSKHIFATRSFNHPLKDYGVNGAGLSLQIEQYTKNKQARVSIGVNLEIVDIGFMRRRK